MFQIPQTLRGKQLLNDFLTHCGGEWLRSNASVGRFVFPLPPAISPPFGSIRSSKRSTASGPFLSAVFIYYFFPRGNVTPFIYFPLWEGREKTNLGSVGWSVSGTVLLWLAGSCVFVWDTLPECPEASPPVA